MPGKPVAAIRSFTGCDSWPRSSAISGSGPSAAWMASNNATPGPGSQRPLTAVGSLAGISQ